MHIAHIWLLCCLLGLSSTCVSTILSISPAKHNRGTEVLEGLVSTSKWPRNEAKFLASSRPRPRKTRIKSLVLKMAEKKAEIPRNSSSRPRKGRGKGKNSSPRLVLDLGKILPKVSSSTSSSPDDPSRTSDFATIQTLKLHSKGNQITCR